MLFPKIEFAAENPKSVLNSSTCNLRSEVKPESKKNPSKSEKNKPVSFSLGMITGSSQCLSGNSFDFNSFSTISSGAITNQFWDFGDGKTATGASVNHSYFSPGNYQVKLIVTSDLGCIDSLSKTITVFPQPNATFTIPSNQCLIGNNFSL